MNMVIVFEIVVGIVVLAAAVRYAVRDTRQRGGATEPEDTVEAPAAPTATRGGEREAQQDPSEVAEHREGEEATALSASSTAPEPPADAR